MATHVVVAVRDSAVRAFQRPWTAPTLEAALRAFYDEVRRPESELGRHPEDYELWKLAEWDEESGGFGALEPTMVGRAKDTQA